MTKVSQIRSFYKEKTIFLTGGTGFLGKALIEKLLYSCEDIARIYVLVRPKEGKTSQERLRATFEMPAFKRLKEKPNCMEKLIPLTGNISSPDLGLTKDEIKWLENEVSIVFHLAATVNFSVNLQTALEINVTGTVELMRLCHRMKNLQAFVHVSTAYSNADLTDIEEKVYPTSHSLEQALHVVGTTEQEYCLGSKPNAYTYSKALAEDIILKSRGEMPAAIIRPSIVISSLKDPCPGWVDNWNGSTGFFVGVSSGVLKTVIGRSKNITDLIPVDIVTNLIIVAADECQRLVNE